VSGGAITIIGPGRMGLAIGGALAEGDNAIRLLYFGRHPEPPGHPLFTQGRAEYVFGLEAIRAGTRAVLIAVPDAVIPEVAFSLAALGPAPQGCVAFHLSGRLPTDVLEPLHERGFAVGSFHPMQAVSNPIRGAERMRGSFVAIEGGPEAASMGRTIADAMGAHTLTVPSARKPLFHAASTLASSYLLPLLDLSVRVMERAGVSSADAVPALISLVRGTLDSVEEGGVPAALGGPISMGDVEGVSLHLRALEPEDAHLYALIGLEVLRIGDHALDDRRLVELTELLQRYADLETTPSGI